MVQLPAGRPLVKHRHACVFGEGFWRIRLSTGMPLSFATFEQAESYRLLLPTGSIVSLSRDGYCLDPEDYPEVVERLPKPRKPDVVDAEAWLAMPRWQQLSALDISEADYSRVHDQASEAVAAMLNRAGQTGVRVSVVLKRKGARVVDV